MKNDRIEEYNLLTDAYYGDRGFFNGKYLAPHQRESPEKYRSRINLAYYLNYTAPCVNAHVDPIFKRDPQREYSGQITPLWEDFTKDTDFAGTDLSTLMKRWALAAKLYGAGYVVCDNTPQPGSTIGEMLESKKRPYAYLLEPDRVKEIKVDNNGKIIYFSFLERDPKTKRDFVRIFTDNGWRLHDGARLIDKGEYALGRVPVARLTSRELSPFDMFPASEFISIAMTNRSIYNKCSWLDDILRNQTFSILAYPTAKAEDLAIGTDNALAYPPDARHTPSFIAPPSECATVLASQIQMLQEEIYRMAVVVNVTGVRTQSSGVAKQWDFEQTNQLLGSFAENISVAETELAELFALWLGMQFDYTCTYQKDFSVSDVTTELANAETAKGLNFGETFNTEVLKRVITSYLPDIKKDQIRAITEEYRHQATLSRLDSTQAE